MVRSLLVAAFLVVGLVPVSSAQVSLKRKVEPGSKVTAKQEAKIDQVLSIAGMDIETSVETFTTLKRTTGKRTDEGTIEIKEKIDSLQVMMEVMGQEYQFDSSNPDNKGTSAFEFLRDVHKALSGRSSTTVLDKENRVKEVKFNSDIAASLPEQVQAMIKDQLDPEYLKKIANQQIDQLPKEAVSKGDKWERSELANFGAGQIMEFATVYTYEGMVEEDGKKLHKITAKVKSVEFSLGDGAQFKLKESNLKVPESKTVLLFDPEKGQVVSSVSEVQIKGTLTLVVNDNELPSELDLRMKTKLKTEPTK